MGAGTVALSGLRVLGVVVALAVVGLGAWAKVIIHDIEIRGGTVLDKVQLNPPEKEDAWRAFFEAAVGSQMRIWIAIAAGSFTSLATILILISVKVDRIKIPAYLLHPLELLAMLAMAAAFGATLSLTLKLSSFLFPAPLDTSNSADLRAFYMLPRLSTGYTIAAGTGILTLACTSISALIQTWHRVRDSRGCSFEPTASGLGMGQGYQATAPPKSRGPVPTMYDPRKPIAGADEQISEDEEKGFVTAGADMGRTDSGLHEQQTRDSDEISGPLGLERPEVVAQMRPARPWSEMPKRK